MRIWRPPSSIGCSNGGVSFISTDLRAERAISRLRATCFPVTGLPEFPKLACQNLRNPHATFELRLHAIRRELRSDGVAFLEAGENYARDPIKVRPIEMPRH
jgi:hypothetical protein